MSEAMRAGFLRFGWLLPALLPLAQVGGRGLFNTLIYLYVLWALLVSAELGRIQDRGFLQRYLLVLLLFAVGIPFALDPAGALKAWGTFALYTLTAVFTLGVLQRDPDGIDRLLRVLGIVGGALLLALYVHYGFVVRLPEYSPATHLKEDNLPFLYPFLVAWVMVAVARPWRLLIVAALSGATLAYLILSQGRAAFLGWVVAAVLMVLLAGRWRWRVALPTVALVAAALMLANVQMFSRGASAHQDLMGFLDTFTSYRSQLWRQAVLHPPENLWIGVGMGNVEHYEDVVVIQGQRMRGLHNFLADTAYETGLLGLAALLLLLGYVYWRVWRAWPALGPAARRRCVPFLAASGAILAAGQLSLSYTSRQFGIYLFLSLAALLYLSGTAGAPVKRS